MRASFKTTSDKWKPTFASTRKSEENVQNFLDSLKNEPFLDNNLIGDDKNIVGDHNVTDLVTKEIENGPSLDRYVPPDNTVDPGEESSWLHKFKLKKLEMAMDLEKQWFLTRKILEELPIWEFSKEVRHETQNPK